MLKKYFKFRAKYYTFIFLGFLVGLIICKILFEKPDYATGITAFLIGISFGELVMIKKWLKESNS